MSLVIMTKLPFTGLNSLKNRMLLIFLLLIIVILGVTLQIVQSATYRHSTGQLLGHTQTSISVVKDKINNRANILENALGNLAKDFSVKQLIAGGAEDKASLNSAMANQQRRIDADAYWVFDETQQLLTSSLPSQEKNYISPSAYMGSGLHWANVDQSFYLVKVSPVKFVESSQKINAWVMMGVAASSLVSNELFILTDMQVSLFNRSDSTQILGSTFTPELITTLAKLTLSVDPGLHTTRFNDQDYIYTTAALGAWQDNQIYILLVTAADKAYLSYNSLLLQLVGLLVVAAIFTLAAAMLLSRGITGPISQLVGAAKKIHRGEYVEEFPTSSTNEIGALSVAFDEMQQGIKEREVEINKLAYFDKLTGLPNRNQFSRHLHDTIGDDKHNKVTVLMMDVDRFKEINDTVGHDIGDRLLILIVQRMIAFGGDNAFYARIGGDEFGIVFDESNGQVPAELAASVHKIFEQPFSIEGLVLDIDASIGVAVYPYDAQTHQGLMQCADIALYSCKGKHYPYAVYKPELNKHSMQRLNLMSELKEALHLGQLELYYQPKLLIAQNVISSVECLIRWIHPVHGFVPPDDFIPLAEQTGVIRHVTHWVLEEAVKQQRLWHQTGHDIGIAVNISAVDLIDMKLPTFVDQLLREFKVDPKWLTLEVTESAIMGDPESALKALNTLRNMGIALSIDDFGTGYSSMAQLKKMPVDELKIDKAFVLDLANNQDDQVMVKTLISLATNLGLTTVAEGVEDQIALQFLADNGCTKAQGYYLSRPLPAAKFDLWYAEFLLKQQENSFNA
jgi:diguanylate cyclase (GGDEF)-like protein